MNKDDLTLVEVVCNGRGAQVESAIMELYNKYKPILTAFMYNSFTATSDIVEDAVSITLGKALNPEILRNWKPTAFFSTWVHSIAYNAMVDILRKEKKADVISVEDMVGDEDSFNGSQIEVTVDEYTAQNKLEDEELMETIKYCIGKLSPVQSDLLNLNLIEQLNDKEIAEITGRKPNSIRPNIHRGKENLKKLLIEAGVDFVPFEG